MNILILICWLGLTAHVVAAPPVIRHIGINEIDEWRSLWFQFNTADEKLQLCNEIGLAKIEEMNPVFLAVVLQPGSPLESFGAYIIELAAVKVVGEDNSGKSGSWIAILSRAPYSERKWTFNEIVSGTEVEPPMLGLLAISKDVDFEKNFLPFLERLFKPTVCISRGDIVIDLVLCDTVIKSLIGRLPSDEEIRNLCFPLEKSGR